MASKKKKTKSVRGRRARLDRSEGVSLGDSVTFHGPTIALNPASTKKRSKRAECPLTAGMPDAEDLIAELPTSSARGLQPITAADVFRRAKKT